MISRRLLARYAATEIAAGRKKQLMPQLTAYITDHRMQHQLSQLVGDIEYELEKLGHSVIDVTSARPLGDEIIGQIETLVSDGDTKTVELRTEINDDLIGGFIVSTPSARLDRSIRNQISNLSIK